MISLNRYQRLAYDNPTIEGQRPLHMPQGWALHQEQIQSQSVTVVVTVSVDADNRLHHGIDAIWEVSVSIWPTSMAERLSHPQGLPIEVSKWSAHHRKIAGKAFQNNTRGIGPRDREGETFTTPGAVEDGTYSAHLHLPMTKEEREELPVEPK